MDEDPGNAAFLVGIGSVGLEKTLMCALKCRNFVTFTLWSPARRSLRRFCVISFFHSSKMMGTGTEPEPEI